MQKFLLGVNYWPRKKGIFWWKSFDAQEVREEFGQISSLGLEVVRLFLLWEDFQPAIDKINQQAIANLNKVFCIAQECGLKILLTLFVGHMSGANWAPLWLIRQIPAENNRFSVIVQGERTNFQIRNIYQDERILAASSQLIREVISSVKDKKSLYGYDLANEIDNFVKLDSREEAIKWIEFVVQEIRGVDNNHPITMGLHLNNIEEDRRFWPEDLAKALDFLSMHSYSLYAEWADDCLDGKVAGFANRLIERMSGAKVMHTEFGICTTQGKAGKAGVGKYPLVQEKAAQTYLANSLKGLYENGALGALFWCYSDYHPSIFNQPPFEHSIHERSFGLFRADGSLKPYKNIIEEYQNLEVKQIPQPKDIDNTVYYKHPLAYLKEEYKKFS